MKVKGADEMRAAFVSSWWNDYVRIVDGTGRAQFVHATRVIAVLDSTGGDITRQVVDQRGQFGVQPPVVKPPRAPKVYRSPLSATIAQGSFFLRPGTFDEDRSGGFFTQIDIGGLWKLGDRHGLGWTFFGSGDVKTANFGVKAWGRRLLRRDLVLDVAPGVVLASDDDYAARSFAPAFLVETGVTYNSWLWLSAQIEARTRISSLYATGDANTEWASYFGVKLGGPAAAPAIGLSALTLLAMHFTPSETYSPPIP